jgi:hypothetical protein
MTCTVAVKSAEEEPVEEEDDPFLPPFANKENKALNALIKVSTSLITFERRTSASTESNEAHNTAAAGKAAGPGGPGAGGEQ